MATTQPTSRQLKGHFNALRATKSHSLAQTIDIAAGNYGSGKTFNGIVDISHPSWIGATDAFYIYIDQNEDLILENNVGFPPISTRIAKVIIDSGNIVEIIDERSEVNGITDGYEVAFDDTSTNIAVGPSVQSAIEALDAYVSSIGTSVASNIQKYLDFDIEGGSRNGQVNSGQVSNNPVLELPEAVSGVARIRYSASIPKDYVIGTDIVIRTFWSPDNTNTGDVAWRLRYRLIDSDAENIDNPFTTVSYLQAAPGIANRLTNTGDNLLISAADISPNDILIINIEREYIVTDTYDSTVRVHLIRMEYMGRGVT